MRLPVLLALLLCTTLSAGRAQTITLLTQYGEEAANADRVLIQGDDGAWREAEGHGGRYPINVGTDTYTVAVLCFEASGPHVTQYRFKAHETPLLRHVCEGENDLLAPRQRLHGSIAGATSRTERSLEEVQLTLGRWPLYRGIAQEEAKYEALVAPGPPRDLLALRVPMGQSPDRAVLVRDLPLRNETRIDIDFRAPHARPLERFDLTVDDPPGVTLMARLHTCNGTHGVLEAVTTPGQSSTEYAALPHPARQACDRYERAALALVPGQEAMRVAVAFDTEPADTRLSLPPRLAPPHFDVRAAEPLRLRMRWEAIPDATLYTGGLTDGTVRWSFVQSASLPPHVTLPAWNDDLGALRLRDGTIDWGIGVLRSDEDAMAAMHAWEQSHVLGKGRFGDPVVDGLTLEGSFLGGSWAHPAP